MRYSLSNDLVSLIIDEKAQLVELRNRSTGHDYAGGLGLWRMIYSHDEVLEEEILAENSVPQISTEDQEKIKILYPRLNTPSGTENIILEINIKLKGDELYFSSYIRNNSESELVIREVNFPTIKNIRLSDKQSLYGGSASGAQRHVKIDNITEAIQSCRTQYMADDENGINMPWYDNGFAIFANDRDGLYMGDHDTAFEMTAMLFRKRGIEIDAGMHRSPFLKPGESCTFDGLVLSPYTGDWHVGARKYRQWAERTWYKPLPRPESLKDGFNGWYRIIMRHQYGKIMFRHDEMPRILKSMKETGINTLLIFGWWDQGMDAGYPEYDFDESQGGMTALKEYFREFRANGGKIHLYFNGRLMDTSTDFYKKHGKKLAIRGCDGEPLIERYMFSGPGIDLCHQFGYKSFALACTWSHKWMKVLKRFVDTAVTLEVDGIFIDQIGMPELPCFAEEHGHKIPLTANREIRIRQLKELREYMRSRNPDMCFGVECATNFTSCFADYFHSFPGWNIASNDWQSTGEKPRSTTFIELFRYIFPEALISDREIRDDTDIERRVNLALLRGLVSDVEVHRCRSLIDDTPHYKRYLIKANKLRERFRRLILNGRFQDTDGASCSNPELFWSVFTAENELAIISTQSHLDKATGIFHISAYAISEYGILGKADVSVTKNVNDVEVALHRNALVVIVFKKI